MKSIIAVNNLGYIGLDGKLLWECKEDLIHFKKLTLNQELLVGYNTSLLLPPLKNRQLVIDPRGELVLDVDWCIGGKKTYEKYCEYFDELHISYINDNSIGDTMFPDLRNLKKDCKIYRYYFDIYK